MPQKLRTILVDDEPLARAVLAEMLEGEEDIEIVAECSDGFEGMKAIQDLQPDLIFLDIQMPKINGFELLELLTDPPPVIFTTAFDEYALKAFEVNALDYLMKPVHPERLTKAIEKVRSGSNPVRAVSEGGVIAQLPEQAQRVVVKDGGEIKIIPLGDLLYLEAADDYVKIHTKGKYFLKHQTMANFERQLPAHQFVRIHRSYIVNVQHINKVELYEKEQYCVILRDDTKLPVSRTGYGKLKATLGI